MPSMQIVNKKKMRSCRRPKKNWTKMKIVLFVIFSVSSRILKR